MLTRSTFGRSRPSPVRAVTAGTNVCNGDDGSDALQEVKKRTVSVGRIRWANRFSKV